MLCYVMLCGVRFFIGSPQCHLAAISSDGNLLAIYLVTCLGTSADRPEEHFDAHAWWPAPPTVEHLQSLQEKNCNSAQQKAQCSIIENCEKDGQISFYFH